MPSQSRTAPTPHEGSLIPSFSLTDADGRDVRVRSFRGRRSLALVFVHGVTCADCTSLLAEAVARYDAYAAEGAELIAVVPAERTAVLRLRARLAAPYPVLADEDGAVCTRYGLRETVDTAVMIADRFGEPRLWQVGGEAHDTLPSHDAVLAELAYLAISCGGGCGLPAWPDAAP